MLIMPEQPRDFSTSPNGLAENVRIVPIIITELKLGDVERHVLGGDLVKRANNAAFEDRPETFNRVGVDRPDDVLTLGVVHNAVRIVFVETAITAPFLCAAGGFSRAGSRTPSG